jgi:S1-C subfamily serine protease
VPGADQTPVSPDSPFANEALQRVTARAPNRGAAISVSSHGVWLTARRVVEGCGKPLLVVAEGWAAPAKVAFRGGDVAVLTTHAAAPPLPLARRGSPRPGDTAFLAGFSLGAPGEVAARLMGPEAGEGRNAWAEIGRTDGLKGPLFGMAGAPVLNDAGEVIGMAVADEPNRGRLTTAPSNALAGALALLRVHADGAPNGQPITLDNYGRSADALRRALSVVPVVCG